MPEFTDKIDFDALDNQPLQEVFKKALKLFENQVHLTGIELGFVDEQGNINMSEFTIYEQEEKMRQRQNILEIAESKKILAHGVDETKVGLQGLADIIIQGYIKARETRLGQVVFAGPLRPQRKDEEYLDYIAESSGDYAPYYIILDPVIEKYRIEHEISGQKVLMPGFYKAQSVGKKKWGLPYQYHNAFLVPTEQDREFLIAKIEEAVMLLKISPEYGEIMLNKIITYNEFIQAKEQVCLLKIDEDETEADKMNRKVLNLSCKIFIEQAI